MLLYLLSFYCMKERVTLPSTVLGNLLLYCYYCAIVKYTVTFTEIFSQFQNITKSSTKILSFKIDSISYERYVGTLSKVKASKKQLFMEENEALQE